MAGRKPLKVTATLRRDVELMKADGWSDDRVAAQLQISRTTLLKHFGGELEFGADRVRRRQLANLDRLSKRNVAAAKALLARADTMPGGSGRGAAPEPDGDPIKASPLGKKDQANLEAQTAAEGTSWASLIKH